MLYIIHLAYPPIKITPYSDSQGSGCGSAKTFLEQAIAKYPPARGVFYSFCSAICGLRPFEAAMVISAFSFLPDWVQTVIS